MIGEEDGLSGSDLAGRIELSSQPSELWHFVTKKVYSLHKEKTMVIFNILFATKDR